MKLSRPCFLEGGRNAVDTDVFERDLQLIISNTSLASLLRLFVGRILAPSLRQKSNKTL